LKEQKLWNRDFVAICFSSFFLFLPFYALATTLPVFVTDELHGAKTQIGLVMTLFIISAVIFRPLTGKWLDEVNRKKLLFISLIIYAVCTILHLGVESMSVLLALRFFNGIGFGMATTATGAIVIDLIPDNRKGEGIGYYTLFMSLAMVLGPFLGLTIIEHASSSLLFMICGSLSVLSLVLGMMIRIPERPQPATSLNKKFSWNGLIEPKAIPIAIAASLAAFSYGAITTFLSVYAKEIGLTSYASYFFIVFAAFIVLPRPFTGKLFDRKGPNLLVYSGIVLFTFGLISLSQATTPLLFLLAGGIIGLGYGALLPSFQTIAIQSAPSHRRGLATSTYFVLFDSGYGLGSYILGIIAASTSYHNMYLISGVIVAFTAVLYYFLHHRKTALQKEAPPVQLHS